MKKTVLVCDDEPHIVHVLASKLRNAGFEVLTADNGQEGVDLALAHLPHVIFTDYQMPQLSGLELCAKLASDDRTSAIPIVILSARGFSLDDAIRGQANIKKVMPKPFSPREILETALQLTGQCVKQATPVASR
jgi:CheY-like chemotaxis protein